MANITVYSKAHCVQCDATNRELNKKGIEFEVVDITTDDNARDHIISLGHLQAPVVVAGEDHWSGFRPDKIKELVEKSAFVSV